MRCDFISCGRAVLYVGLASSLFGDSVGRDCTSIRESLDSRGNCGTIFLECVGQLAIVPMHD
jgi:hypothetical protein